MKKKLDDFGTTRLCPKCKGEQFLPFQSEDGKVNWKWCPTCKGSGIHPADLCYERSFVFAQV